MRGGRLHAVWLLAFLAVAGTGEVVAQDSGSADAGTPVGSAASLEVGTDRLAAGLDVTITDSVAGDLMAAGAVVSVRGPVAGDVLSVGGRVAQDGRVAGSLRAAGGEVVVSGRVGRNVTLAGGTVRLAPGAVVAGNAYLSGGEVVLAGEVRGHVRASGGVVRILGVVDGSVEVTAERVVVGRGARVTGSLVHRSPEPAEVAPEARVRGAITHRPADDAGGLESWLIRFGKLAAFLLTGLVLVALAPGLVVRLSGGLTDRPWQAAGLGVAATLAAPIALLLVGLTLLGLPLMLIGGALYFAALYVARAVVAVWLGRRFLDEEPGRGPVVAAFLLGGTVLGVAGLLPWIGWLVTLAATLAGLGAAVDDTVRRIRDRRSAAAAG